MLIHSHLHPASLNSQLDSLGTKAECGFGSTISVLLFRKNVIVINTFFFP